jgi:hypothetical protein
MHTRHLFIATLILGVSASSCFAGCGDETDPVKAVAAAPAATTEPGQPAAEPAAKAAAPAMAGAVKGTVKFEGEAPKREPVDLSPDAFCKDHHAGGTMESPIGVVVGAGGGLKDVFLQLTGVPDVKRETPTEPVTLDQVGCTYVPHVFGIMKKQTLKILNSDATLHNIHSQPKDQKEFNKAMPNKGDTRDEDFRKAEDAIRIKCDVHPWMATFCFVLEHPYFAVSGADGSFSIPSDLPDGEYGYKAWHEVLGEQTGKVTIKDGAGSFDLTFKK